VGTERQGRKARPITKVTSTALGYAFKEEAKWHVDPLLGSDHEISSYTTAVARQWLISAHVGTPTDANATEGRCFLRGPYLYVISRIRLEFSQSG
jgi:hypothetical protein